MCEGGGNLLVALNRVGGEGVFVVEYTHLHGGLNDDFIKVFRKDVESLRVFVTKRIKCITMHPEVLGKKLVNFLSFGEAKIMTFVGQMKVPDGIIGTRHRVHVADKGKSDIRKILSGIVADRN